MTEVTEAPVLDALGKRCPEPMLMIKDKFATMNPGDPLKVIADTLNKRSIERFVKNRGHQIVDSTEEGEKFSLLLRKAEKERGDTPIATCPIERD